MTNTLQIEITLNGTSRHIANKTTIVDLLSQLGFGDKKIAVEVNENIIPRSQHLSYAVQAGDRIEIVHAVGGG